MVEIPRDSWASGGALAVWSQKQLVVVTKEGEVFAVTRDGEIAKAPFELPDNGFEDYREVVQSPAYEGYTFQPHGYRYNDMMAFDEADGRRSVYISGTFFDREGECYVNRLWRTVLDDASVTLEGAGVGAGDWEVVYDTQPCLPLSSEGGAIDGLRASGRMTMGEDGIVYLISGDYGLEGVSNESAIATDPQSDYGKILAIDPATGEGRVFSQGHRNPGGIVFDREGRLWAVEHGVRGGDELNLIEDGRNYGWPFVSLGTAYNGMPLENIEEEGRHTRYTPPIFAWLPSVGMDALTYVEGFDDTWDGDLLAGSLSSEDYGHRLFRIRIQDGRALFAEEIKAGDRVRDVVQWGEDVIAVMRDDNKVILFRKADRVDHMAELEDVLATDLGPEMAGEVHAVVTECSQCHSFTTTEHRAGPSLKGVLGRPVAGTTFDGYSDALKGLGGVWDGARIAEFVMDPNAMAPGSGMPAQAVNDETDEGLIRALELLRRVQFAAGPLQLTGSARRTRRRAPRLRMGARAIVCCPGDRERGDRSSCPKSPLALPASATTCRFSMGCAPLPR